MADNGKKGGVEMTGKSLLALALSFAGGFFSLYGWLCLLISLFSKYGASYLWALSSGHMWFVLFVLPEKKQKKVDNIPKFS